MRRAQVTLLDLGLADEFNTSMKFVDYLIGSLNVRGDSGAVADVNFVRTRDSGTYQRALYAPASVLHVMAHGVSGADPTFVDQAGTNWLFLDLEAEFLSGQIQAAALLADACKTGTRVWRRAVRSLLAERTTYIGTRTNVSWLESTVFTSGFYSAMFRAKGKGVHQVDRAFEAANKANRAFEVILDRPSPYTVEILEPLVKGRRAA